MSEDVMEYVAKPEDTIPVLTSDTLIALAEAAEKRIEAVNKIKMIALRVTNSRDWLDMNGKPYLQGSGAEKVARQFGISWKIEDPILEFEEGGHYSYTYKGKFSVAGVTIETIGSRSTKDKFFMKYEWQSGVKVPLPLSEIDRGDVKKSAYTNCIASGVGRLLGIRNLTYADLAQAGIKQEELQGVQYKEKGKAKEAPVEEGATTIETTVGKIAQRTKKADGTPMKSPLFLITCDGVEYKTFSESLMKTAQEGRDKGIPVVLSYTSNKFGNDITALALKETTPEPQGEAA